MLEKVPTIVDMKVVQEKFPVVYEQSMNTVLAQEVIRWVMRVKERERGGERQREFEFEFEFEFIFILQRLQIRHDASFHLAVNT